MKAEDGVAVLGEGGYASSGRWRMLDAASPLSRCRSADSAGVGDISTQPRSDQRTVFLMIAVITDEYGLVPAVV